MGDAQVSTIKKEARGLLILNGSSPLLTTVVLQR